MLLSFLARPRAAWLLLAAIALLRAPGLVFGVLDIDESDLVVAARAMADGGVPYVDFVEKKPPLLYLFYWPAAVFGWHMWPIQLLAILWTFATAWVVGRAARLVTSSPEAGAAAAWLTGLASACNVLSVNAELLLNLPAAAAMWCFLRAEHGGSRRNDVLAGFFVAFASLFKHQAGIGLVAIEATLLWQSIALSRGPLLARHAAVLGGFVVPWAATALVYAALGHLDAFLEWNVARNFLYSSVGVGSALARFGEALALSVVAAAPLLWWRAIAELARGPRRDVTRFFLLVSVWATWIPVSLGLRFYTHYFLQFVPALALLAAPYVAALVGRWPSLRRGARAGFVVALALPVVAYTAYAITRGVLEKYPAQEPKTRALAAWLRAHTPLEAKLFVWGHYTPIYYLAERGMGTRYYNTSTHVGDFDPAHLPPGFDLSPHRSHRDIQATVQDLEVRRPEYVVDTAPADIHAWSRVPLAVVPEIASYVSSRYEEVARAAGAIVYRRRDAAP
jgi:4-amino-4-deoxy-L-arabinose transferase-like glycosyltransferase